MNNRKIKLILTAAVALFVFVMISFTASAAEKPTFGTFKKNIMWSFDTETRVLTISGKGDMPDADYSEYPWIKYYEDDVKTVLIEEGITHIGTSAFQSMINLKVVEFPDSLESIGEKAFYFSGIEEIALPEGITVIPDYALGYCQLLKQVYIPDSVEIIGNYAFYDTAISGVELPSGLREIGNAAFNSCEGIKSIQLGDKLETIKGSVFSYCTGLESIAIPDSVTALGGATFRGCTNLKSVTLSKNIENIGTYLFYGCTGITEIEIPEKVKSIGAMAFVGCTSLKKVKITGDITSIENNAFENCKVLEEINLTDTVAQLGHSAFKSCAKLREVKLGEGLETIYADTFYNCTMLERVNIPSTVKTIGDRAFYKCTSLKEADIPSGVTAIGTSAFSDCSSLTELNFPDGENIKFGIGGCSSLKSIRIPSNVEVLSLKNCASIESIEIPATVTTIAANCFMGCSSLKEVVIPETAAIESVNSLFSGCTSLERVVLPESVTTIGNNMFAECTSLKEITVNNKITAIGEKAFYKCSSLESFPLFNDTQIIYASSFKGTKWYESKPEGFVFIGNTLIGYNGEIAENTEFVIPEGTECIAADAFSENGNIVSVKIPESVIAIEQRAFYDCANLSSVSVPNTALRIGKEAFHETAWYKNQTGTWVYLGKVLYKYKGSKRDDVSIKITSSIKAIADYAFHDVSSFWFEAEIPVNVEYIGRGAFYQPDAMVVDVTVKNVNCEFGSNSSVKGYYKDLTFLNSYGRDNNVHEFCKKNSYDYTELTCKHSYVTKSVIKKAGCTENGEYLQACKYCGAERTYKKPPVGHSFVTEETVNPTCTEPGYMRNVCSSCGELDVIITSAKGHKTVKKNVAPTCENEGYTSEICGVCGFENKYDLTDPAGHAYQTVTVPATQEKDGYTATVCSFCGKEESVTITQVKTVYLSNSVYTYDGSKVAPDVSVKDTKGNLLEDGTDYLVKYTDNIETGIGTANVIFRGNYSGSKKLTYKILPENVGKIKATATHNSVKLTWSEVSGATGYYIYTYSSSSKKYTRVASATETAYTFSKLKSGKKYTYYVKAYKSSGEEILLSEDYTKASTVTLLSVPVKLKVTAGKKKATLSWKKVSYAEGYEIVFSISKSLKNPKKLIVSKGTTVKKTVGKLSSGKKYYFKIRAFKTVDGKKIYSSYTAVKAVKVK